MKFVIMRSLLISIAGLLIWRITAQGLSGYYVDQMRQGDPTAAAKALIWLAHEPSAQYRTGVSELKEDPERAAQRIIGAYAANPADARPLMSLAMVARDRNDQPKSRTLIAQATKLYPVNARIHRQVAAYWISQGDLAQAMLHWSIALEAQPSDQTTLFPSLLKLAEQADTRGFFAAFMASPPTWWDAFFATIARRALDLETVRSFYAMRRNQPGAPLTENERKAYIARLQKDHRVIEAYLVWVNGLTEKDRSQLGLLNNGGFELEPSNSGFDWHILKTPGIDASTAKTFGSEGNKAMHLIFKRREAYYSHIYQPLFLDPAYYRLRGLVRTDGLDSLGGLKWIIQCTDPIGEILGESDRFLGSSEWHEFAIEFLNPDTCRSSEIRLISAGSKPFEHKMSGGIWFDSISLRKIPNPAVPLDLTARKK